MARTTPVNSGYTIINGSTTGTNGSKVNTWIEYKVTAQSIANNTSTVRVILYSQATIQSSTHQTGTARQYGYVQVGGGTKYYLSTTFDYADYQIIKFADHTFTVSHNVDGTKTVTIAGAFDISAYVGQYITGGSVSKSVTLPTIPQYATITQTVQSKTETSITMNWTTDSTVDKAYYSKNGGTNWTEITIQNGNSGSYTITGLTANTTYSIKTRVRKLDSQLTSDSTALSVATYSYPYANIMPNIVIGDTATIGFFNPLGREFTFYIISNGTQISNSWTISGTSYSGLNDATTKTQLYATIPNTAESTYQIKCVYGNSTITKPASDLPTISAKETDCKPSISALTYADVNSSVTAITGDASKIVQGFSTVRYTASGVSGNYSASISSISVAVYGNEYNLSLSGSNWVGGNESVNSGTNVEAVATVIDSRGFTNTASVTLTMYAYNTPSAIITLARHSNFYSETDITVDADYSSINGTNAVTIQYRIKKTTDSSYGSYSNLSDNVTSTFTADNEYQWNVQIVITDSFGGTVTYNKLLARGMPIVYFDRIRNSVGVNCFPDSDGTVYLNGRDLEKGFKTYRATYLPSGADLNDYLTVGTYSCTGDAIGQTLINSPEQTAFLMWVYNAIGNTPENMLDGSNSRYFIQELTTWNAHKWIRRNYVNSSGTANFGTWERLIDTSALASAVEPAISSKTWEMDSEYKAQIFDAMEYIKSYKADNIGAYCLCQFNDVHGYVNSPDIDYLGFKGNEPNFIAYHGGSEVVDLMIFNGDIATASIPNEYTGAMEFMQGANTIDSLFAMGNHEYGYYNTYNVTNPETYFKDVINVNVTYSGLKKDSSSPEAMIYYYDASNGTRYIVLNYYYINETVDTDKMLLDTNQSNWLASVLAGSGSKNIVIIGHTLLNPFKFLADDSAGASQDYLINQNNLISIITAFKNRSTYGSYSFASCTGKFIMYTAGHYHASGYSPDLGFNAFTCCSLNRKATTGVPNPMNGFTFYVINPDNASIQMIICSTDTTNYIKYNFTY